MNKTFLIGRLTKDPELRYSTNNVAIINFTIAIDRQYTNKDGQRETDFIRIVSYNKQAENVKKFIKKGSLVAIDGRIQTGSYDDKDGKRVYTTDVIADRIQFLDNKNTVNASSETNDEVSPRDFQNNEKETNISDDVFADFGGSIEISDDDIAF